MEDDNMDSLFEGMVLFTPSQLELAEEEDHRQQSVSDSININNNKSQLHNNNSNSVGALDENLFSDLTLVVSSSSDPFTSTNRQLSRKKKKKAASLRIGYARDHLDDDDQSPLSTPTSVHHLESPVSSSSSSQLSIDDQFLLIKSQISDKLHRSHQLAASVSSSRKDAIARRRKAAQLVDSATSNHRNLELQLEAACESEDFEAAQRISDSLSSSDQHRIALLSSLREAESLCDSIDAHFHRVLNSLILSEQECASLLSDFSKDAEYNADLVFNKARSISSQWFSSSESLEANKIQLDIESHFINEARLLLHNSIDHSIQPYKTQQDFLLQKKDILTDELHQLLALVKAKENEISQNDSHIKAIEDQIADVVSGFQDAQSTIDAKYDHLQSQLSDLNEQAGALSTKKKEIDDFFSDQESHGDKLRELARISLDEANAYQEAVELRKTLMLSILKSREDKVRLAKTEEKLIDDVQLLQHEVSSARASLQELSSTKSSIQQTIASFKQRIFFIDKRIPELEAEKKVAAAARNFKEAARIAAEAKSLGVEKDGAQMDLEKATVELEKLEEDINNTVSRLQDTEQLISSKEKEVAMARFQSLLLVAGAATAERSAALELGDTEEASLLLAEAEAANAEAKKLQPIYNFNEEELSNIPKHFISMELVSKLGRKQLAELAASVDVSAKHND